MKIAQLKAQLRQELSFEEVAEMDVSNADLYDATATRRSTPCETGSVVEP